MSNSISFIDIVNPDIKSLEFTNIMSDSEEKTPTVSPDQGATSETAATQSEQAGGIPSELPWFLFVEDPMMEYERNMMLSGHKPSTAPPLPPCEQNNFAAFEKEFDFAFEM